MNEVWRPRSVAICVPVRDERALLPAMLDGLARQHQPGAAPITLCIAFDGCSDDSEAVVSARAPHLPFAVVGERLARAPSHAGRARRAAMALGAAHARRDGALLTTDADTVASPEWLRRSLDALAVADVVAGRILRRGRAGETAQNRLDAYLDALFTYRRVLDPVAWEAADTHHHTGGASLGMRSDAHAALGGFPDLPSGEDAALIDAAHRLGLRVRRDAAVVVETSSRRCGRAVGGLADHLRQLDADGSGSRIAVGDPRAAVWQYAGHAAARAAFPRLAAPGVARALAARIARDEDHVRRVAAGSRNAEAFATAVVPAAPGAAGTVPLAEAERLLAAMTSVPAGCAA